MLVEVLLVIGCILITIFMVTLIINKITKCLKNRKFKGYLFKITYGVKYGDQWIENNGGFIRAKNLRDARKQCRSLGLELDKKYDK